MSAIYELKTWLHDDSGNFFQNVFHYDHAEAVPTTPWAHAKNLVTQWVTDVLTDYLSMLGTDIILDFITGRKVTGGGGPTYSQVDGSQGSAGNMSLGSGLAADLLWVSSNPTNKMGHTFISGVPEGAIQGSAFQVAYIAILDGFTLTACTHMNMGADGTAVFGTFTRKTNTIHENTQGAIRPKPTYLNKRSLPVI